MTPAVSTKPASTTGANFNDHSFFSETLRSFGHASYDGADVGKSSARLAGFPTATRPPDTCSGGHSPRGSMPALIAAPQKVISLAPASPNCKQPLPTVRVLPPRRLGE